MATSHDKPTSSSLLSNLGFGVACGVGIALMLSLFVGVLAFFRGSDWNPAYQVSTLAVIRGYLLGGVLGGTVFGFLRPVTHGRLGATVIGMIVGPIVYGAMATAVEGQPQWGTATSVIPGVLVGGVSGWIWGKPEAL